MGRRARCPRNRERPDCDRLRTCAEHLGEALGCGCSSLSPSENAGLAAHAGAPYRGPVERVSLCAWCGLAGGEPEGAFSRPKGVVRIEAVAVAAGGGELDEVTVIDDLRGLVFRSFVLGGKRCGDSSLGVDQGDSRQGGSRGQDGKK